MAFSTLRQYNVQHAMNPTVQASRGAGGAPGAGSIPTTAQGSPANDYAALGGAGAMGAGILGKFLYDRSRDDLLYKQANPEDGVGIYGTTAGDIAAAGGNEADVLGGLAPASQSVITDVDAANDLVAQGQLQRPGFLETIYNIPSYLKGVF